MAALKLTVANAMLSLEFVKPQKYSFISPIILEKATERLAIFLGVSFMFRRDECSFIFVMHERMLLQILLTGLNATFALIPGL